MKRIIILLTGVLSFLSSYGQGAYNLDSINLRFYDEQYLLPEIMNECVEISLDILPYTNRTYPPVLTWNRGYICLSTIFDFSRSSFIDDYTSENVIEDYAQPYYTDTTITIIGISGYESNFNDAYSGDNDHDKNYRFSFELRDSSLNNIIRSVDVTDTSDLLTYWSTTRIYKERFFDTPVNIKGNFYIVYHTKDEYITGTNMSVGVETQLYATTFCSTNMYPLVRRINTNYWTIISAGNYDYSNTGTVTMLYLFPILSEYNPNAEEWHGVGLNETRDISQFTHVFPNPANSEVNVNCGYKIKTLQVFDEQGKRLFEKEVNAYNYQINLENYPTGTYLIKVLTNSGQATKKVIKE